MIRCIISEPHSVLTLSSVLKFDELNLLQVSVNRSGKSKVIFTMGVARDFCTKLTAFANFLAQGKSCNSTFTLRTHNLHYCLQIQKNPNQM